jgi:hypothetical protein
MPSCCAFSSVFGEVPACHFCSPDLSLLTVDSFLPDCIFLDQPKVEHYV